MKVEPISVSGSYEYLNELGLKRWKKISIGATITEEDNVLECITELDKKVEEAYKKISKELSIVAGNEPVPEIQVEKETPLSSMIKAITTCTEIATLKTFEKLAKSKPEFQKAYDETMQLLINNTKI
jgi:hypothetical protein